MTPFEIHKKILILIPAYNEQGTIAQVIDEVRASLPAADIAVISDGSSDRTAEIAAQKEVFVLVHQVNLGIGSTVQTGIKFAERMGYQIAIQVDGDGQHNPNDLPRLISPLIQGDADMTIGSRFLVPSVFRSSLPRRFGILFFTWLYFLVTGKWITDPTSGFRAMNRQVIERFALNYPYDYPEPEVLVTLYQLGIKISEVPVTMKPRSAGFSSISFGRSIYYMFKVSFAMVMEIFRTAR